MTTVTASNNTSADIYTSLNTNGSGSNSNSATAATDKFLTMLVAQMQNQDPLNPMDNAQVTSQMAQINTVSGLEQVNTSVLSLNSQLLQMQALQGATLVNRPVTLAGNQLSVEAGVGSGGFAITDKASSVEVQVKTAEGKLVDTVKLGPQEAGVHRFEWKAGSVTNTQGYTFTVVAKNGTTAVSAQSLQYDRVTSVSTAGDKLTLALQRNGSVPMDAILSFN
jgi:flagellar basal-body rod modification protein FlgD